MKFIEIKKYIAKSFEGKPSFIIVLEEEGTLKEFIYNGCVFKENTEDNIKALIEEFDCEFFLEELLNSPDLNGDYSGITD